MRILLIHQFFLADGEAGGSRFNDMTLDWAKAGHDITVLADSTHYQSGVEGHPSDTTHRRINVIRIKTSRYAGHGKKARIRSYGQFAIGATRALKRLPKHDVVIASSPSLPVVIPAFAAKRKWDIPFVFEVRDLWPESAISTGVISASSFVAQSGFALEELAYEICDHVVALSPGIKKDIEKKHGNEVTLIPNGVHPDSIPEARSAIETLKARSDIRRKMGWKDDEFVMVYVGAHGIANDLNVLIESAAILEERGNFKITLIGDGPHKKALVALSRKRGLNNIEWLAPIPKEETFALLGAANAGLAVLQRNPTFRKVYPNKIFDYMSVNIPTICAIAGDAKALIETHRAGLYVHPEHAHGIADAAIELSQKKEPYMHTRKVILDLFNRQKLAYQYLELLEALTTDDDGS